jgi:hypothetical protein
LSVIRKAAALARVLPTFAFREDENAGEEKKERKNCSP